MSVLLALMLLQPTPSAADARFDTWDADESGFLTKDELPVGAQRIFERVDENGDQKISQEEFRRVMSRALQARQARVRQPRERNAAQLPPYITLKRDLPYANSDNKRQTLDLYLPLRVGNLSPQRPPLIVYIHGGAWRAGSKDGAWRHLEPFLKSGECVGASVGYRLTDEAVWPAQIHDVKAAIRFLKAHADEYGFDPDRIGLIGTSAGGHLVTMLGVAGDAPELEGDLGTHTDQDSKVACVVNMFGPVDLLNMEGEHVRMDHRGPNAPESKLVGGPIMERKEQAKSASPVTHVTKADAPFLTIHGTHDPLVPVSQAYILDKALKAVGVSSELVIIEGAKHGGFKPEDYQPQMLAFFRKHLKPTAKTPE